MLERIPFQHAEAGLGLGGLSAIIFILGIFVFITREGFGFIVGELDFREFFASPRWRPTSEWKTTYGILALIAGTASAGPRTTSRADTGRLVRYARTHTPGVHRGDEQ